MAAVRKLVADGCAFEEPDADAAAALRREIFRRAAAERRAASPSAPFDRGALLEAAARERGTTADALAAGLYADRPARQRLVSFAGRLPAALAAGFELAEAQAVLLRATRVTAKVRARDAATYRALFRTLKFLRLFPTITATGDGGYTIALDGPLSLFQGSTRYGLQLGLALPAIAACDVWSIEADVRWGGDRRPLRFRIGGGAVAGDAADPPPLPDELAAFVGAFEKLDSGWRIDHAPAVLDLPGAGVCVPDLAFVRAGDGARVHFELLGFWSREAVWRRVDLVRAGLPTGSSSPSARTCASARRSSTKPRPPPSTSSPASSPPSRSSTASSSSPPQQLDSAVIQRIGAAPHIAGQPYSVSARVQRVLACFHAPHHGVARSRHARCRCSGLPQDPRPQPTRKPQRCGDRDVRASS